ncbi:MAG: hypothetical protein ABSG99_06685 [Sedimentisphaerales bacterium]
MLYIAKAGKADATKLMPKGSAGIRRLSRAKCKRIIDPPSQKEYASAGFTFIISHLTISSVGVNCE